MRDVLKIRSRSADPRTAMSALKGFLSSRSYTVEDFDHMSGRLTARKASTILVILGMDRSIDAHVKLGPDHGRTRIELHWRGLLKGCAVSFTEAFMLALILGRDLGVQGLLVSLLAGSAGSTINLAIYLVQRTVLRRTAMREIGPLMDGTMKVNEQVLNATEGRA